MDYSEFLQKFYHRATELLVGYKSKNKVGMFFFEYGLDGAEDRLIFPSDSTYEKWETGERKPQRTIWMEVQKHYDGEKLQTALIAKLNENYLETLANSFEIYLDADEQPDKVMLSRAIAAQFHAIALSYGSAENVAPEEYKRPPEMKGFNTYLREAKRKHNRMKLPGNEECAMDEFFVCNNIGQSSAAFPHRIRGTYVENATLPMLRRQRTHCGDGRNIILISACGFGKTLMLQHLFLEAADHVRDTGLLPIFAELRHFSDKYSTLFLFLLDAVQEFDPDFTEDKLRDVFEKGNAEVLLDGLDEMNPEEANLFQLKLARFCHHYPNNQVVISSRQCATFIGIREFSLMYIHPLNEDQVNLLIDKILTNVENEDAKKDIQSFIRGREGFIAKNGFIATNPMLLSVIVRHYEEIKNLHGNRCRFYELL